MCLPAPFLSSFAFWRAGSQPTEHEWLEVKRIERARDPLNGFAAGSEIDLHHASGVSHD